MMKPNFDDVIEYVKAGEDDPEMEEMLDLHPDGQELLKQARFICKVLRGPHGTAMAGICRSVGVADAMLRSHFAENGVRARAFPKELLYQSPLCGARRETAFYRSDCSAAKVGAARIWVRWSSPRMASTVVIV